MKKKYLISFIIIVSVLIASVIAVAIIANIRLNNLKDDKYYKIGEVQIQTIKEVTNTNPELKNYSYGKNGEIYTKYFEYKVNNAESVVEIYTEYLSADENFSITTEKNGERTFKKIYENSDELQIQLIFSENIIEVELTYKYVD